MNNKLIEIIKNARLSKGLKQSDVAAQLDLQNSTISNYENGVTEPDMNTFISMCSLYGINAAEALTIAYGSTAEAFAFTLSEQSHIKKYRGLDNHGKKNVDLILDSEYTRCTTAASLDEPTRTIQVAAKGEGVRTMELSQQDYDDMIAGREKIKKEQEKNNM